MTRILCLWFPNWPIQRAVRTRPELKGRPLVLVMSGPRGGEVGACCSKAVAQGVRPGMPVAEAQSLARNLMITAYDAEADRQALTKCAEVCGRFSPRVAIEEGNAPESLLLDISNLEHLWGSENRLIEEAKAFFTSRGYIVRRGVGETVGAAWATAHFEGNFGSRISDCGSKRAGRSAAPTGDEDTPTHLQSLPVQSLRIAEETTIILQELGIETIGQLAALPREALAARFGEELLRRLDQLTGTGREVIEPRRAQPAFDVWYALEEPTNERGMLLHVLRQLVKQLARQLAARDQGAVVLECFLYLAGGMSGVGDGRDVGTATAPSAKSRCVPPQLLRVGLLQPSACACQLLELLELHLEAAKLAGEINRVELRAKVVGRLSERQGELFADRWSMNPHQLAVLVNRFTSRLGQNRVLRAELRASAVPERAVQWGEVARREARGVRRKGKETGRQGDKDRGRRGDSKASLDTRVSLSPCLPLSPSICLPPRPLSLYPQPQALEVVCVAPDGPPQAVWLGGRREPIVACTGPERIESLWWRGPSVRRDYYRVATEAGIHLWLFRRLGGSGWFMHGVFA